MEAAVVEVKRVDSGVIPSIRKALGGDTAAGEIVAAEFEIENLNDSADRLEDEYIRLGIDPDSVE